MVSHSSDHYMLSPQACDGHTIIIPTYTANLNCHELRVASSAALAPPIIYLGNRVLPGNQGTYIFVRPCTTKSRYKLFEHWIMELTNTFFKNWW